MVQQVLEQNRKLLDALEMRQDGTAWCYSWISYRWQTYWQSIFQRTERFTNNPRPSLKTPQKNAFNCGVCLFFIFFCDLFFITSPKTAFQKGTPHNLMRLSVAIPVVVSDFLYLARFVGKLIFFIIYSRNCFVQNKWIPNNLNARVVTTNTVFDN